MPESPTQSAPITWIVPECPFTIECIPRVLDDIRLSVVDAFFSLPRGGAEIGGVLLGRHTEDRVTVVDYVALDCEHAMGPSFALSARDETRLRELLDQPHAAGLCPVGWYHSHTRSEIFLSDADLLIHKRFFPEPWQVALVCKPHTFQPMRCGFFFRAADGVMRGNRSEKEFDLEAMPLRLMPGGVVPSMPGNTSHTLECEGQGASPIIDVADVSMAEHLARLQEIQAAPELPPPASSSAAPAFAPAPASAPEAAAPALDVPKFGVVAEERSWRWLKLVVAILLALGAGALGFQTRDAWLPNLSAASKPAIASPPASLALSAIDTDGQLQIRWDRSSPIVQQGTGALLTIADGGPVPRQFRLDSDHLRGGSFTFARQSAQVDVSLAVTQPSGSSVRTGVGYVGKVPAPPVVSSADAAQIAKLKSDLETARKLLADQSLAISQANQVRAALAAQTDRAAKLQRDLAATSKQLAGVQSELRQQQRKRLGAQDPGK